MKRFFFLAVAATMAFAACNKTEVVYPDSPQEISFTAVSKVATKAPVAETTFSTGDNMSVAAYIVEGAATTPANFFESTLFSYNSGVWSGTPARYWPLTTSKINFLAVTEKGGGVDKTTVAFNATNYASAATVTLAGNNQLNQNDLMFAAGQGTHTQGGSYTPVNMIFKHALAWVNFKVKTTTPAANATITVNSITLNGAAYGGTLMLTNNKFNSTNADVTTASVGAEWTSTSDVANVIVPNTAGNAAATAVILDADPELFGNGLLVVPGDQTSFTINYTVTIGSTSHVFNYTYTIPGTPKPKWVMAMKYTYNVTISLNEIQIAPVVEGWDADHDNDDDVDADDEIAVP